MEYGMTAADALNRIIGPPVVRQAPPLDTPLHRQD
jgi:hypothetical protein